VTATRIRSGLYDRVRFILHKPEDDEAVCDPAFRQGTSGDQRFSVVITGYYHETPFTFMSREDARQELRLSPPLLVTDDGTVNLTLKIDPYAWFTRDSLIFDPFNEGKKIDDRIKEVFGQAYRDNDRNGEPD
jgi:hypothetical protein